MAKFTVTYHRKVVSDFKRIAKRQAEVILEVIETKLAEDPELYGKPLRRTLKNLRSLRIGNYRVVYSVRKKQLIILVLIVGNRDTVYREAEGRVRV